MRNSIDLKGLTIILLAGITLAGCSTYAKRTVDTEKVTLQRTQSEIPDDDLLDVRIEIFDPGTLPEDENAQRGLSESIRKAEAHYIPVQLRNTIQQTGYWASTRVVPKGTTGAEVLVSGRILESDGEILKVEVQAKDATGAQWFKETYQSVVDIKEYEQSERKQLEVFQKVYDRISNDLTLYRGTLTPEQVQTIRQVSELRFASAFAPNTFNGYLQYGAPGTDTGTQLNASTNDFMSIFSPTKQSDNLYQVLRLPSEDDEMLQRVRRIRVRDYLLADTLDGQYDSMYRELKEDYTNWRKFRLTEVNAIRKLEDEENKRIATAIGVAVVGIGVGVLVQKSANNNNSNNNYANQVGAQIAATAAVAATQYLIQEAMAERDESGINLEGIVEDGESFSAAAKPLVMEVEGQTMELTGSAEAKYSQWREILKRLHEREVGPVPSTEQIPATGKNL